MGEVYRARDADLGRDVAIKVLPEAVAQDIDRLARFRREAQILASLNHPNIGSIYGLVDSDGVRGLVLELVEGDTLRDMLTAAERGLPVDQAVRIARQIADALDAAHGQGIIHRDLKPANVKVTPSGLVKLLDFGLGKEFTAAGAAADSMAATAEQPHQFSRPGMVLGTVGYMSPEQVRAGPIDPRTDLFSLGIVLYEMTTGQCPFVGPVATMVFDAILHGTPTPPRQINPNIPPALERVIVRLLEKDPAARYTSATEVSQALRALEVGAEPATGRARPMMWAAVGAVLLVAVVAVAMWQRSPRVLPATSDYVQVTHVSDSATSPSMAPDGKTLAFIRGPYTFAGPGQIYVKALPDGEPVQLTRDEFEKMSPVFSPDGSRVTYTTVDQRFAWDTWMVPVAGGDPQLWLKNTSGLSWTDPVHVLFSEITGTGIHMRVAMASEDQSDRRPIYDPADTLGMAHRSVLSPDRTSVLIVEMVSNVFRQCRIVPADGSSPGRGVGPAGQCTAAAWSPDGRWMYFSAKVNGVFHLWRQRSPEGTPEQLTSGPSEEEGIAVAPDGRSLLTSLGTVHSAVWVHDARGDREVSGEGNAFVPSFPPVMSQPFAADGRKLLYLVRQGTRHVGVDQRSGALWMVDLESARRTPLFPGFDVTAYDLSRDGARVVFSALDDLGRSHLWIGRLDGQLPPRQISAVEGDGPRFGLHDDIYFRGGENAAHYIFRLTAAGETQRALVEPILFFLGASPDAEWLLARVAPSAYAGSNVVAFSAHDGRAVTLCADCEPDWAPGGRAFVLRDFLPQKSLLIALAPGETLPRLPATGLRSEADVAAMAGVVETEGRQYPGLDATQYAYMKVTTQRNIYRIPLE